MSLKCRLSDHEQESLNSHLALRECTQALKHGQNNSSGIDGLTLEFCCHFWDLLVDDVLTVYHAIFNKHQLTDSHRTGVICLLYKKGDREELRNWRPIMLLTIDYKILSKALAIRLTGVKPTLVHPDQTCCVPRRMIQGNTRLP